MDQCSQFSNLTYLESNPGALEQLLAGVPKSDVEGVDQETLMAMVSPVDEFGAGFANLLDL